MLVPENDINTGLMLLLKEIGMKRIIFLLVLLVLVAGCVSETPKSTDNEQEGDKIADNNGSGTENQWEVYNTETGETEKIEKTKTNPVGNIDYQVNELLKTACRNAINDYPDWTVPSTDLLIWEDSENNFNFRNSPEDMSTGISSPVKESEGLADMDFIGSNEISYVKTWDNGWGIGTFKLNGMSMPMNTMLYEIDAVLDSVDISPINYNQFIVFSTKEGKAYMDVLDAEKSTSESIFETMVVNTNTQKVSVSPRGNYAYLLYDDILRVFEIHSREKKDEMESVKSVVWVGDSYLLYSNQEGTFIYDIKNSDKKRLDNMGSLSCLAFNPKEDGVIAYSSDSESHVVECQTWKRLNSLIAGDIETLASERTAIIDRDGVKMYWRFKDNDWILTPSHIGITIYATLWKRY